MHLPLHAVAVQHMNEVLLLLHLNGNFTDTDGFAGASSITSDRTSISFIVATFLLRCCAHASLFQFPTMPLASQPTSSSPFRLPLTGAPSGSTPVSSIQMKSARQQTGRRGMWMQLLGSPLLLQLASAAASVCSVSFSLMRAALHMSTESFRKLHCEEMWDLKEGLPSELCGWKSCTLYCAICR